MFTMKMGQGFRSRCYLYVHKCEKVIIERISLFHNHQIFLVQFFQFSARFEITISFWVYLRIMCARSWKFEILS